MVLAGNDAGLQTDVVQETGDGKRVTGDRNRREEKGVREERPTSGYRIFLR